MRTLLFILALVCVGLVGIPQPATGPQMIAQQCTNGQCTGGPPRAVFRVFSGRRARPIFGRRYRARARQGARAAARC